MNIADLVPAVATGMPGAAELLATIRALRVVDGDIPYVIQFGTPGNRRVVFHGNLSLAHRGKVLETDLEHRLTSRYGKRKRTDSYGDYVLTVLVKSFA